MAAVYTPRIGFGGKLEVDLSGWVEIAHCVDFNLNVDTGEVDVSHQQGPTQANSNPAICRLEALPAKSGAEVTFTLNLDPGATEHKTTILSHLCEELDFRYTFDDDKGSGDTVWLFTGFFRTPNFSVPNEDKLSGDVSIRITGAPTFTGTYTP